MGVYPFCVRPRDVCAFCETKPKGTLMKKESPGQAQAKPADQPQAADQPQSEDQPKTADQSESYYNPRSEKFPHALKHGAFSALSILPGEDPKEFIELYQSIAAELLPDGPIEKDAVKTIAVSIWRASRLTIFRRAEWARAKYGEDDQNSDEIPKTEPARSQYKKLMDSAKQHERAGHVLHDIATIKIEKHFEVLNTAVTELNMAGLKGFQNEVQVLNSAALQCLPDSEVKRITDFVASQAKAMKEIIGTDPRSRAARAKLDVQAKT